MINSPCEFKCFGRIHSRYETAEKIDDLLIGVAVTIVDNDFTLKVLPGFETSIFFCNVLDFGGREWFHLENQALRTLWKKNKADGCD